MSRHTPQGEIRHVIEGVRLCKTGCMTHGNSGSQGTGDYRRGRGVRVRWHTREECMAWCPCDYTPRWGIFETV